MVKTLITGPRSFSFIEEPDPDPGDGEIVIKAALSGVSIGTEMAVYRGQIANLRNGRWGYWNSYPMAVGYEMVGYVVKAGKDVSDVREGDRIIGLAPHGTHGVLNHLRYTKVADSVSDEEATLTVLGATTMHGVRRAGIRYGERVLVLGLGVVGTLAALHVRRGGAQTVIVADPSPEKRAFAASKGFTLQLDPLSKTFEQEIKELTNGIGVDAVIEASGHPSAIEPAMAAAKVGGRILILGTHTQPVEIVFSDWVTHKELTIIGTWRIGNILNTDSHYNRWNARTNLDYVMELIARGDLPVSGFATRRMPFRELPELYRKLDEGVINPVQVLLEYD